MSRPLREDWLSKAERDGKVDFEQLGVAGWAERVKVVRAGYERIREYGSAGLTADDVDLLVATYAAAADVSPHGVPWRVEMHHDSEDGYVVLVQGGVHVNVYDDELPRVIAALQARHEKVRD